jgi:hypothetical protein
VDRPINPYGVDTYITNLQSVFLPAKGKLASIIETRGTIAEGEAYLGLIGIPMILLLIIGLIKHFFTLPRLKIPHLSILNRTLVPGLAGIIIFLYASGFLNTIGLKYLNEILPPLKQFRSLGRFAWISYYLLTVSFVVIIYNYWITTRKSKLKYLGFIPLILFFFWTYEAYDHYNYISSHIRHENNISGKGTTVNYKSLLAQNNVNPNKYQSLLSLPIIVLGPERIQVDRGHWPLHAAMPASYQLSLPMFGIMMSRTSVSQGMNLIELLAPDHVEKHRLKDLNDTPILIMSFNDLLSPREQHIIDKSKYLFNDDQITYYEILPSQLYQPIVNDEPLDSILTKQKPLVHFDYNESDGEGIAGGAGLTIPNESYEIWKGTVEDDEIYEASFWLKVSHDMKRFPDITFRKFNSKGMDMYNGQFNYKSDIVSQGNWLRIEWSFDRSRPGDVFSIVVDNSSCIIDEFQIRKLNEHSYAKSGEDILFDNYKLSH